MERGSEQIVHPLLGKGSEILQYGSTRRLRKRELRMAKKQGSCGCKNWGI